VFSPSDSVSDRVDCLASPRTASVATRERPRAEPPPRAPSVTSVREPLPAHDAQHTLRPSIALLHSRLHNRSSRWKTSFPASGEGRLRCPRGHLPGGGDGAASQRQRRSGFLVERGGGRRPGPCSDVEKTT
jgi:hypothetical protein